MHGVIEISTSLINGICVNTVSKGLVSKNALNSKPRRCDVKWRKSYNTGKIFMAWVLQWQLSYCRLDKSYNIAQGSNSDRISEPISVWKWKERYSAPLEVWGPKLRFHYGMKWSSSGKKSFKVPKNQRLEQVKLILWCYVYMHRHCIIIVSGV